LHDLRIDGDDAVELFQAVHARFGTDLTHLEERWRTHFGPEGFPLWVSLLAVVTGASVAILVGNWAGDIAAAVAGAITAIAVMVSSNGIACKLGLVKALAPVTVADVVQAVEAGSWPRPAPSAH
jgi:hypothetical protein